MSDSDVVDGLHCAATVFRADGMIQALTCRARARRKSGRRMPSVVDFYDVWLGRVIVITLDLHFSTRTFLYFDSILQDKMYSNE